MARVSAPVMWMGGKGHVISKILGYIPYAHKYVEPYLGAGNVLLNRQVSPVEVVNDLDGDVFNLYSVLKDKDLCEQLEVMLQLTPYSRLEYRDAINLSPSNMVEKAWRFMVVTNMNINHSPAKVCASSWSFTFLSRRNVSMNSNNWLNRKSMLHDWHKRVRNVNLFNVDALEIIKQNDSPDTVFYLDPPYESAKRTTKNIYTVDKGADHHRDLTDLIIDCDGSITLSGYENEHISRLEKNGWSVFRLSDISKGSVTTGKNKGDFARRKINNGRQEIVCCNPKCMSLLGRIL